MTARKNTAIWNEGASENDDVMSSLSGPDREACGLVLQEAGSLERAEDQSAAQGPGCGNAINDRLLANSLAIIPRLLENCSQFSKQP